MNRKISFFLVTVVALMLAACGGGAAAPGGGTTLSETYNADGISFKYPSGWVVEPAAAPGGPVIVANNQATLDAAKSGTTSTIAAGQQFIFVLPFVGETFQAMSSVVTSPVDLLTQMGPGMSSGEMTFGTPTETTVGGKPAARASGSGDAGDAELIAISIENSGYVMVMGGAGKGEIGNLQSTLNAVAETVAVTAPAS